MKPDYDVAVVGAGPAGSTFARLAAAKGRRILLLDGQNVYTKKPCGGLLAPDAQKVLAHFDLVLPKSVLADPQIFSVKTIDLQKRLVRYYQRYYLNMDRYAFDRWLLSLVPEQVDRVDGKCLKIERLAEGFQIYVSCGGKEKVFSCSKIVVFVKYGRVGVMDEISELTGAEVTCTLIGERPGLITAESMSAYIAYKATVGMPEARRTVVSNIHRNGTIPAEAGAHIADIIKIMLEKKASGTDLKL